MRTFLRKLRAFFFRNRLNAELEEEMRLHVAMRAEQLEHRGLSAEQARTTARLRFGNAAAIEERSADIWGFSSFDRIRQDVRFALRRVRQNPGFSIPVIAVLALGIGATTAVFSAIDAAFLRPLPFAHSHQLVSLPNVNVPYQEEDDEGGDGMLSVRDVAGMSELFSGAAAFASGGLNLSDPDNPVRVNAGVVTADFFRTLGVSAQKGRTFTPEEGKPKAPLATVLSYGLWQRYFNGADVIGKTITLHLKTYQIVGIMPRGFSFPNESDLWIPMSVPTTSATFEPFRGYLPSRVFARVAAGVTPSLASSQLLARWQQRANAAPEKTKNYLRELVNDVRRSGAAVPLQRELVGDREKPLTILMGATALLLLIACANVANLLLSESAQRRREVAVRQVLGATRVRIVRQLLAESVTLSLGGALLGIALAPAALTILRVMLPADLAGIAPARLVVRVLVFTTLLALVTAVVFGLWPAIGAARHDTSSTIKSGGGHGSTAGHAGRARRVLVIAELALTVMLLVGAGLMIRSFDRLMSQDFGMDPRRVATLELSFARFSQAHPERVRIIQGALERLTTDPAIEAAGAVNDLPLRGSGGIGLTVDVPGAPPRKRGEMRFVRYLMASGGYFKALGIDMLRGRTFTPSDDQRAPPVAIVSKAMAAEYWPNVDPVGRTFNLPGDSIPTTVIGVVDDVRESRADRDPGAQMYLSIYAQTPNNAGLVAHSSTLPASVLLARMREAVRATDPRQAVFNVRMMEDVVGNAVAPRRTNTLLIAIFAVLALVLAALGVYAVVSYGVAQRTREFGIRSALGASGTNILALVSREMMSVIVAGVVIGLGGAWALSRVLESQVYGVDVHDRLTFLIVPVVLLLPAAIATLVPATRAMRANPTEVMRAD